MSANQIVAQLLVNFVESKDTKVKFKDKTSASSLLYPSNKKCLETDYYPESQNIQIIFQQK